MKNYMSALVFSLFSFTTFAQVSPPSPDDLLLEALENASLSHMRGDPQAQLLTQIETQMNKGPMGKGQVSFTRTPSLQPAVETFIGVQKHTALVHMGSGPYCLDEILTIKGLIFHKPTDNYEIKYIRVTTPDDPYACI
jgi:hypothetical protein